MQIHIKEDVKKGVYKIDIPLYNREDCLGIDYDNCEKQITLENVSIIQARRMINELERYIRNHKDK